MTNTILFAEMFNTLFIFYNGFITDQMINSANIFEELFEFVTYILYMAIELFRTGTDLIIDILTEGSNTTQL